MKTLRTIIIRFALVLLGICVSLVVLELGLRVLDFPKEPRTPAECEPLTEATVASYAHAGHNAFYLPNSIHAMCNVDYRVFYSMDSLGYLGTGAPDPEQCDLLVIGDSMAFGLGVEPSESFASRLGAYNAGIWGRSFGVHASAFARTVSVIKPRRVLWILSPTHLITLTAGGWRARLSVDPETHPILSQVIRQYNTTRLSTLILMSTGWGANRNDYYTWDWVLYDAQDATLEAAYGEFEKAVAQVVSTAEAYEVQVIPVFVPSKKRLALGLEGKHPLLLHMGRSLDAGLPVNRMSEILNRQGVPYDQQVDLMDLFRNSTVPWRDLYFEVDAHLNAAGHQAVADYLSQKLREIPTSR